MSIRLAFAAVAALGVLRSQQEVWVDPVNGNDSNPGSWTQPVQTLGYAVGVAGNNAKILLLPGTYGPNFNGETLPIAVGAVPQANLVIRGIGTVTFDLGGSTQPLLRLINGANGARITNITIANSDQAGWWTRAINSGGGVNAGNAATNVEIDRCRFVNLNRGFVLWTSDNVTGWRIHDNLFWNLTNDAILEYSGTNAIYNNTFAGNTWKAYISDSPNSVCYNNLIVGCNIAFENNSPTNNVARYQDNWAFNCNTFTSGQGFNAGMPASNVNGQDPLLVNSAGGDFHLLPGSPLIENGNPNVFARADLDGNSRLVDSDLNGSLLPEIGAYEVTPVAMASTWDAQNRLLFVNASCTAPGSFLFVLFAFEDGVVQVPGHSPILLDQATFIPAWLSGPSPMQQVLNMANSPPFLPGTRIVMHTVAIVPGVPSLVGGNQVWVQL
jgi:hypothetical protein